MIKYWKEKNNQPDTGLDKLFDLFKELISGSENNDYDDQLDMNTEYFIIV